LETALIASSVILWLLVLFNLLFTLALVRRVNSITSTQPTQPSLEMGLPKGSSAPDFTAQALDGKTATLQNYLGKQTIFVFFSPNCQPCQEILPRLEALKHGAARAGVTLVLVSGRDMESTQTYIEQNKISLPVLVALIEDNPFMTDYKATATPSYCHINAEGRIASNGILSLQSDVWKDFITTWSKYEIARPSERR
jgi:peroxiredoxin